MGVYCNLFETSVTAIILDVKQYSQPTIGLVALRRKKKSPKFSKNNKKHGAAGGGCNNFSLEKEIEGPLVCAAINTCDIRTEGFFYASIANARNLLSYWLRC